MRKLSAHYIYPANRAPLKFGILILDDDGIVLDLIDTGGKMDEEAGLEFYPGILTPGFINAHCHIELSHLNGVIPRKGGLTKFIDHIGKSRFAREETILKAINTRAAQMYQNGISAVGDTINTDHSLEEKLSGPIKWFSFIEIFGLRPELADSIWYKGKLLESKFKESGLDGGINPHAPYSISTKLWELFNSESYKTISIHNQESMEEEELMGERKGNMAEWLKSLNLDFKSLPPKKNSSLTSYIDFLPKAERYLFVHNTYSSKEDIEIAVRKFDNRVFWVLCPNANLYIENHLPENLISEMEGLNICLGTDSLASNSSLSILEEMITLQSHFPDISIEKLIKWGTLNGAKSLGMDQELGSFEKGKKPGVVWINNIDFDGLRFKSGSKSKRLV